jgi:hypothetical protein
LIEPKKDRNQIPLFTEVNRNKLKGYLKFKALKSEEHNKMQLADIKRKEHLKIKAIKTEEYTNYKRIGNDVNSKGSTHQ